MTTIKVKESPTEVQTSLVQETTSPPDKEKQKMIENNLTNTETKEKKGEQTLAKTTNMPSSSHANKIHSTEETNRIRTESKTNAHVTSHQPSVSNNTVGQVAADDNKRTKDE